MVIGFHSIVGYDKIMKFSLISSFFNYKIVHLDTLSKIKKWVKYINGNYDYNNLYYYQYALKLYGLRYTVLIDLFKESKFQPNRFIRLDFFSRYSNEKSVFRYLSHYIYSVRKKSPLSIVNMWNVYMLINNLRYCSEQNNIYRKIDENRYEYFSELDYLPKNIKRIWLNIISNFSEYFDFPINRLISDYLQSSIEIINTIGSASTFLPIINSDFNIMTMEERNEFNGFKNREK